MRTLLVFIFLFPVIIFGQNLDKIGEDDMVKVSGGVNSNLVYNNVIGQEQFRDPFAWVLSGNVNVSFLDFSMPFTFSFSNAGVSYSQPFNMTALHPTYKNFKSHIGITSMTLSPYTYSGLNFAGAGLEYTPKKWAIKAFGGRLKKAVEYDASFDNLNSVSYQRYGFGVSAAFTGKIWGTEIILFKAFDDSRSLEFHPVNPELTARDNVVGSWKGNLQIWKTLSLKAEIATSLLTRDILALEDSENRTPLGSLVQGNQTTILKNAYNGSIDYRAGFFGIGLKYERIDPGYATLGTLYFNDDIENITVNPSFRLLKNKVNLQFSTGYQRNNLSASNTTESKRWIGTAAISAQLSKQLNFNANYSNMSAFTRRNPTVDPFYNQFADTLNYYQISQNTSATLSYNFGDSIRQSMQLTGSYAQSENITGRLQDAGAFGFNTTADTNQVPVDVYNAMFAHRIMLSKSGWSLGWTVNGNHTIALGNTNSFFGPGLNVSKPLFKKKLALTAATTYNQQLTNQELSNHVLNYRMGLRISPEWWDKKYGKLNISLNGTFTNRLPVLGSTKIQNTTVIANLAYFF